MDTKPRIKAITICARETREPGSDYAHDAVSMPASECVRELNALRRHLRGCSKDDYDERAETLACIMHIRARQLVLASQEAAIETFKDIRAKRRMRMKWAKHPGLAARAAAIANGDNK